MGDMTDDYEDEETETILSKALVAAKTAFWKSLEDGGWDIPIEWEFRASELDREAYATTIRTVRIDNIERNRMWRERGEDR